MQDGKLSFFHCNIGTPQTIVYTIYGVSIHTVNSLEITLILQLPHDDIKKVGPVLVEIG